MNFDIRDINAILEIANHAPKSEAEKRFLEIFVAQINAQIEAQQKQTPPPKTEG